MVCHPSGAVKGGPDFKEKLIVQEEIAEQLRMFIQKGHSALQQPSRLFQDILAHIHRGDLFPPSVHQLLAFHRKWGPPESDCHGRAVIREFVIETPRRRGYAGLLPSSPLLVPCPPGRLDLCLCPPFFLRPAQGHCRIVFGKAALLVFSATAAGTGSISFHFHMATKLPIPHPPSTESNILSIAVTACLPENSFLSFLRIANGGNFGSFG